MKCLTHLVAVVLLAGAALAQAQIQSDGASDFIDLDVAAIEYPPHYHTSRSGNFSGFVDETVKAICNARRLKCNFKMWSLARSYRSIETGELQVLLTANFSRFKSCCVANDWHNSWKR